MKTTISTKPESPDKLQSREGITPVARDYEDGYAELERSIHAALETYSNVHRGSGHNSLVSTHLYEKARNIVLECLGLDKDKYTVVFCAPRRAEVLKARLRPGSYQCVSSQDIGLPLGVRALAVRKKALPRGVAFQSGGGTARLVYPRWVIWARSPDKFEAGTPAIINVITFAKGLRLIRHFGKTAFQEATAETMTAAEILYRDELEPYSRRELLDELRQTLIGRGVRVPTAEGTKNLMSTWTTAPARPHLRRYGMLSIRHGTNPGKCNKRSSTRSKPYAPTYWEHLCQLMT